MPIVNHFHSSYNYYCYQMTYEIFLSIRIYSLDFHKFLIDNYIVSFSHKFKVYLATVSSKPFLKTFYLNTCIVLQKYICG